MHPFADLGAVLYGALFVLHFVLLYVYQKEWQWARHLHIIGLWFFVGLGSVELHYHVTAMCQTSSASLLSFAVLPLVVSLGLLLPKSYKPWLEPHRENYQMLGAGGLVLVLGLWQFTAFSQVLDGSYIPLFNLLDMMQIAVLAVMAYWGYKNKSQLSEDGTTLLYSLLAIMGFLLITVMFARTVHQSQHVAYTLHALWQSNYFQTGLSLLWSALAIVFMVLSKRYMHRTLWVAGFGLLIVVVLKLFFVELVNSGTIERIISFMVVGMLLLLVGYFVPMPPHKEEK